MAEITKYSNHIIYNVSIDGVDTILVFTNESKSKLYHYTDTKDGSIHKFSMPLAKYPKHEPFSINNHTYIIKTKP